MGVLFSPAYALKCKGPEGCCGGGEAFLEKKAEFNTATAVTTPELVDLERQINKVDFTYPDGRADKTVMAKTDELSNSVNALIDFTRNIVKVLQQFDLAFKSHENQHDNKPQIDALAEDMRIKFAEVGKQIQRVETKGEEEIAQLTTVVQTLTQGLAAARNTADAAKGQISSISKTYAPIEWVKKNYDSRANVRHLEEELTNIEQNLGSDDRIAGRSATTMDRGS